MGGMEERCLRSGENEKKQTLENRLFLEVEGIILNSSNLQVLSVKEKNDYFCP